VQEAAVAPARPPAALLGLEHDHLERRIALPQGERGPEPGESAADDRDVGLDVTLERWRGVAAEACGAGLLQPPNGP